MEARVVWGRRATALAALCLAQLAACAGEENSPAKILSSAEVGDAYQELIRAPAMEGVPDGIGHLAVRCPAFASVAFDLPIRQGDAGLFTYGERDRLIALPDSFGVDTETCTVAYNAEGTGRTVCDVAISYRFEGERAYQRNVGAISAGSGEAWVVGAEESGGWNLAIIQQNEAEGGGCHQSLVNILVFGGFTPGLAELLGRPQSMPIVDGEPQFPDRANFCIFTVLLESECGGLAWHASEGRAALTW